MINRKKLSTLLLCLGFCATLWSGCDQNPCEADDIDCGDFGSCIEVDEAAICVCQTGYDKDSEDRCQVKEVTKFLGTWQALDIRRVNGSPRSLTYELQIEESSTSVVSVFISNLGDLSLVDYDGNVRCEPRLLAFIGDRSINIQDVTDGVSYCDGSAPDLNFSGYRFRNAFGEFNQTQDTLFLEYELTYTIDDEQGNPVTTEIVSETALTRP